MISLKTLEQATAQQVFDQVSKHLLNQNAKSITLGTFNQCRYKSDGLMCAAGCLIADDEYEDRMEHIDWIDLVAQNIVPSTHSRLIYNLQEIHDGCEPPQWRNKLTELANNQNLIFNDIN